MTIFYVPLFICTLMYLCRVYTTKKYSQLKKKENMSSSSSYCQYKFAKQVLIRATIVETLILSTSISQDRHHLYKVGPTPLTYATDRKKYQLQLG